MGKRRGLIPVVVAILVLAVLLFRSSPSALFVSPPGVVGTVKVGERPWDLAYDSSKGEAFVADGGSDTVSVIG